MGNVIDSSIFMAAERKRFDWSAFEPQLGSEPAFISVVTVAELAHGIERADSPQRRAARLRSLENVEGRFPVLPFTREIALVYARVTAAMEQAEGLIGALDLIIAATALCYGHSVATLNAKDF